MLSKVIYVKKPYKGKDGKQRVVYNFYLVLVNGARVPIQPLVYVNENGEKVSYFNELKLIANEEEE